MLLFVHPRFDHTVQDRFCAWHAFDFVWATLRVLLNFFVPSCVLAQPMLKYYTRMQDIILRNCRRRVERGEVGASTRAQVVWETITKESTLRGTSVSSEAKQDFGYWMDHRISYEIKIDDESVMLKFGLEEDPIAVARVSCVLYVDIRARSARTSPLSTLTNITHTPQVRTHYQRN